MQIIFSNYRVICNNGMHKIARDISRGMRDSTGKSGKIVMLIKSRRDTPRGGIPQKGLDMRYQDALSSVRPGEGNTEEGGGGGVAPHLAA